MIAVSKLFDLNYLHSFLDLNHGKTSAMILPMKKPADYPEMFYRFLLRLVLGYVILHSGGSAYAMGRQPPAPVSDTAIKEERVEKAPLTLEECYDLALVRSESLAIEKTDIELRWANFLQASGEAVGDLNFRMSHFRQEPQGIPAGGSDATATAVRSERRTRQFILTQPLFRGFRTLGAVRAAKSLRTKDVQEYERAKQLLFLDVATAFYSVVRREKDIRIQTEILDLFQRRVTQLTEWEEIGKSRESETISARSRLKLVEADLAIMQGSLLYDRRLLEFLTGISLEDKSLKEPRNNTESFAPLEEYLALAAARPDVMAAEAQHQAAKQNIIIAQSDLWPEIALSGNTYEKRDGFQSSIDWDMLITIDVPLYTGGTTVGNIKAAAAEAKRTDFNSSRALRLAELEIKQAYDSWNSSIKESKALNDAAEAARRNYEIQAEEYERSLVNNLDVLEALETYSDVQIQSDRAFHDEKLNYWRLKVATGECCGSIGSYE